MENSALQIKSAANIAIVENEAGYRKMIHDKLANLPSVGSLIDYSSAEQFWHLADKDKIDVLFLDISMPGLNGLDLVSMISEKGYPIKIIMLTNLASEDTIIQAIKRGAIGYLWKSEINNIAEAVDIVLKGGAMISPTIALKMMNQFKVSESEDSASILTTREKQILDVLVSGVNCEKAAGLMDISVYTVRTHVRNIYEKLQVKNRTELVKKARDLGLG
jgi:DNA-binding NarL/FixJ family response regulator